MAKAAQKQQVDVDFGEEDGPDPDPKKTKSSSDGSIVELDMNLDEYDDYEPLPPGGYPFTVTLAETRTSEKGNDFYYCTLQIHPDDYPADYDVANAPEGANITYARMQKPDPKNRRSITAVKNWFKALGMSTKTSKINPAEWEGKQGKVILKYGKFNNQPTNEIVAIEALDD